ncbi:probable palmitoyltransferase ZDHHC24 [Stomoxys calcitrans]|uniref:probable palmitoyltransferase ZDHHC24 n=1 Tax=Stomoxys calcitrans TaxID=35570 RepID=UPI0027E2196E|nr:probable palmitoyltransferase ZDHHC24 [Stomoxys calcitrans]
MKIRKNVLPRRIVDWLCFLLIGVFLPIVFIFEMIVVLPAFHEPGGFWHTFTFTIAMFLIFNIKGNFLACLMIDTSVDFASLKTPPNAESMGWRHCKKCDRLAPPRSWHCSICKCCILKRDHHCLFVGCCVGHRNHRYFMMFVVFLFIGATYAFVYNSLFLWVVNARIYRNFLSLLKMTCPLLMTVSGSIWQNMFLVFYNLNILAVVYSVVLLWYHGPGLFRGGVCYEKDKNFPYGKSSWRQNFETVFGKRMHLVWLSPLFQSELPDNGIDWQLLKSAKKTDKLSKERKKGE